MNKQEENKFSYNFYYESITKDLITKKNIVALIDNFKLKPEYLKLKGSKISLSFNKDELRGNKIIRVAVSKNGKATSFQTVRLGYFKLYDS